MKAFTSVANIINDVNIEKNDENNNKKITDELTFYVTYKRLSQP